MTFDVRGGLKSFFLPNLESLNKAWVCFKKLDGWGKAKTVALALLGSIVPVYGNVVVFRYCSVKFSKHVENKMVTRTTDKLVKKVIMGKPGGSGSAALTPSGPAMADEDQVDKLLSSPRPPSFYGATSPVAGASSRSALLQPAILFTSPRPDATLTSSTRSPPTVVPAVTSVTKVSAGIAGSLSSVDDDMGAGLDEDQEPDIIEEYKKEFCAHVGYDYGEEDGHVYDGKKIVGNFYDEKFDLKKRDLETIAPTTHQTPKKTTRKDAYEAFLREQLQLQGKNLEIGIARDNGDCFFDAVAQGLQDIKILATITTLRQDVAGFIGSDLGAQWAEKVTKKHDCFAKWEECKTDIGKSFEDIEEENKIIRVKNQTQYQLINEVVSQINEKRLIIRNLQKLSKRDDKKILDHEKKIVDLLRQYDDLQKQLIAEKCPVWGMEARDGQIIADKYNVNIEVTNVYALGDNGQELAIDDNPIMICPAAKVGVARTIHIALYPGHFVPLKKKGP